MNRNYKVIWNRSLGCFTAVAEYAKSRGKSSKSSVSSNATINTTSNISSASIFRMTTLGLGLVVAGFSMQAIAAPCTSATSVECGTNATASLLHGVAIGKNATAQGSQAIAIGGGSNGQNTTASGEQSIAIGANVVSSGNSSIAIGGDDLDDASKNGVNDIFKGYTGSNLIEDPAAPYDGHTESSGAASVAIGVKARSEGVLSTAVGVRSSSSGSASSAFGMGSSASKDGSVALGAGSTTLTNATKETTMIVGGKGYNVAGHAANAGAQVSVGSAGMERQIKHVAAGAVNKDSTDAVNGSQLHATNTVVNKGFGLKAADGNTVMKPLGEQVEVVGSNSNITTKVVGGKIAVALNNDLDLGATGSVTMGKAGWSGLGPVTTVNSLGVFTGNVLGSTAVTGAGIIVNGPLGLPSTTLTTNGLNIIGGPSVTRSGIDAGNKRVTRVLAGDVSATSTDAINGSQLHATNQSIEDLSNTVITNKTKYYSVKSTASGNANNDGATGINAMAMGGNATAAGSQAIAIGTGDSGQNTTASGEQSIAIGANVVSSGNSSIAIGGDDLDDASKNGVNDIFKGYTGSNLIEDPAAPYDGHTESSGAASVAIGVKARSEGVLSTAVGVRSSSSGSASSAFGMGSSASKDGSVALGAGSTTLTNATKETTMIVGGKGYNVAGHAANAGAQVSVGSAGMERQIKHVAAGAVNKDSTDAVNGSQLHATNTVVNKGFGLKAADGNTVMKPLGEQVEVVGSNSNITTKVVGGKIAVALNNDLDLGATGSVTMGKAGWSGLGPVTTVNSLGVFTGNVLGSTAVTGAGIIVNGPLGLPSTTLTTNGLNIIGGPSVTRSGIDAGNKRVTRVLAGDVSATSTDAINGSQLHATNQSIEDLSTGVTTKGLDFAGNDGVKIHKDLGQKLEIVGTLDDSKTASAKNIRTVAKNGKLEIQLADDLDVTSVTTGNSLLNNAGLQVGNNVFITNQGLQAGNTRITDAGLTFTGSNVAVTAGGINAGGKKITNVDDGLVAAGSKDAVNGGQLQEVKDAAANANKGWDISAAGGTATNVAPGTVVDFNSKDTNITVSKNVTSDETSVSFELNRDLILDSATFGDVKLSTSGLDNGGKTITNVGDGLIAADSKDAINGGQINQVISDIGNSTSVLAEQMDAGLNFGADTGAAINKKLGDSALNFKGGNNITTTAVGSSIEFDLNGEISLDKITTGNTSMSNSGVAIIGGPNQSVILNNEGLNNGGNKITNVADGMAPRDAVNFGQLDAVSRGLGNSINELGYRVDEVEDDANAGISAAMAMSSLPQAYIIGKSMIGGGIATYNGESAVAIGFSKLSDDGRWVMKLNGTADTQGNVGAAIGAGFHFD